MRFWPKRKSHLFDEAVEFPFIKPKGSDAEMFIQWKGTDVCMDFHCPCQPEELAYAAHFDGYFAYYLRCPKCNTVYELGTQVIVKKFDGKDPLRQFDKVLVKDLEYHDE